MSSLLQSLSNSSAAFNQYLICLPCWSSERLSQRSHSRCGPKILTYYIKYRRRFGPGVKTVNLPNALQGALLYKLPCENLFKIFNKFLLWRCLLQQQRDSPFLYDYLWLLGSLFFRRRCGYFIISPNEILVATELNFLGFYILFNFWIKAKILEQLWRTISTTLFFPDRFFPFLRVRI